MIIWFLSVLLLFIITCLNIENVIILTYLLKKSFARDWSHWIFHGDFNFKEKRFVMFLSNNKQIACVD